jgi:hypothetical protein
MAGVQRKVPWKVAHYRNPLLPWGMALPHKPPKF